MNRFPEEFLTRLSKTLQSEEAQELVDCLMEEPLTSVRINPSYKGSLIVANERIIHAEGGFFLKERPLFTADPAFHAGIYYPQEANSMWIGVVFSFLRETYFNGDSVRILDLCAAPGGKSTDISSRMHPGDLLVANEVISSRNAILFENICKWGMANTVITKADATLFGQLGPVFDILLIDAPCSGEGMFRKDPDAIKEWSLSNVTLCTQRQQRIVMDAWNTLKPGGFLIYSTCTFNREENEDNVAYFVHTLGAEVIPIQHPNLDLLLELEPHRYRCLPHRSRGEGLFFCVLQKPDAPFSELLNTRSNSKKTKNLPKDNNQTRFKGFTSLEKRGESYVLRGEHTLPWIYNLPGLVHPGVPVGPSFNDKWKAHSAIALIKNASFNLVEASLDSEQCMSYLRREFVSLTPNKLGTVHVKWNNKSLGTANAVKQGLNNLLPLEWRVRNKLTLRSIVD
jgi:16S rRNA C967 or C1407 C5-methylase (RsmB/RsmF family)/NOL1/NOP2/fmu family ribosome biogenesis protein